MNGDRQPAFLPNKYRRRLFVECDNLHDYRCGLEEAHQPKDRPFVLGLKR